MILLSLGCCLAERTREEIIETLNATEKEDP